MSLFFQPDDIAQRIKNSGMSSLEYMRTEHRSRRMRFYAVRNTHQIEAKPLPKPPVEKWNEKQRKSWETMVFLSFSQGECERIIQDAAVLSGFTVKQLKGEKRGRAISRIRHWVCWRARNETSLSLPAIGKRLGHRDHTTILSAIRKFQAALDRREEWAVMLAGDAR